VKRRSRSARRRRAFLAVAAAIAAVFVVLGGVAAFGPGPAARSGAVTEVQLPRGVGVAGVAEALKSAGVIRSALVFQVLARATGAARSLKAGEYAIPSRAPVLAVLSDLRAGRTIARSVTLPEGLTSAMIVRQLQAVEWLTGEVEVPAEGTLLPETYRAERGDTRQSLLDRMRGDQQALLDRLWAARRPGLPLASPEEAVILASIVEKETGLRDERRRVAAVFINRLRIGMRLQSDPTVIYGLGQGFDGNLRRVDLERDSPYNTYVRAGLPPTPIAAPGAEALFAAASPPASRALYFVAKGDGTSEFSENLDDHNRAVNRYQKR